MILAVILIVCGTHSHDIYASERGTSGESQGADEYATSASPESRETGGYESEPESRGRDEYAASESAGDGFSTDVNVYTSYNYLPVGSYDSADTAILQAVNTEERKVTLYNTNAAKSYTLNYDGTTYVSDKYGTAMSIDQLSEGTIVNVNFFKSTRQLVDIQISPEAWTYDSVTRYNLGGINSTASIGDRTYALTKGVQVFSEGKQTDLLNIVDGDSITVSGIGYDIYSIKVDSGHGYVRLSGDEALIGGWIEIGGVLITKVTEPGMLLTVPEGTYTVQMYNDNSAATRTIMVERNQEILLDCSDITAPVDTFGRIIFHVTPSNASLKMDGQVQDISGIVKAEYGIHEIEVSASGYDTLQRYINVGNELAEITINLDQSIAYTSGNSQAGSTLDQSKKAASANSSKTASSASGNKSAASANKSKTVSTGKTNRVYVYAPEGAEVYVDGIYSGLVPMSFKKTAGSHTIILKKTGYETRSYTIYAFDDGEDMSISFSELTAITDTTTDTTTTDTTDTNTTDTTTTDTTDTNTTDTTETNTTDTTTTDTTDTNTTDTTTTDTTDTNTTDTTDTNTTNTTTDNNTTGSTTSTTTDPGTTHTTSTDTTDTNTTNTTTYTNTTDTSTSTTTDTGTSHTTSTDTTGTSATDTTTTNGTDTKTTNTASDTGTNNTSTSTTTNTGTSRTTSTDATDTTPRPSGLHRIRFRST